MVGRAEVGGDLVDGEQRVWLYLSRMIHYDSGPSASFRLSPTRLPSH